MHNDLTTVFSKMTRPTNCKLVKQFQNYCCILNDNDELLQKVNETLTREQQTLDKLKGLSFIGGRVTEYLVFYDTHF